MSLQEQLATLVAEGKAAATSGDLEKAKEIKAQIAVKQEAIKLLGDFEGAFADVNNSSNNTASIRPPLPGQGAGAFGNGVGAGVASNGGNAETEQGVASPATKSALTPEKVYIRRYGDPDSEMEAVMADAYNANYKTVYAENSSLFMRYLRSGDKFFSTEQREKLRTMLLHPDHIKAAIMQSTEPVREIKAMVREAKAAMIETGDTAGGYFVTPDVDKNITSRTTAMSVVRPLADVVQTSSDRLTIPKQTGGNDQFPGAITGKWVNESPRSNATDTVMTLGIDSIPVHSFQASVPITLQLLEDSYFDLAGYVTKMLGETFAITEDNAFLVGDGVGKPQGILPGNANTNGLPVVNSGTSGVLTWNAVKSLTFKIPARYIQEGAFIGHRLTFDAISQLTTSGGMYTWQAYQFSGGTQGIAPTYPRLLGFQPYAQDTMPQLAASSFSLLFGNLRTAYKVVDRLGTSIKRYDDGIYAEQGFVKFIARHRVGGQLIAPWAIAVLQAS